LKKAIQPDSIHATSTCSVAKRQNLLRNTVQISQYGFTWCGSNKALKPLCVTCGEQLANQALVLQVNLFTIYKF